MIPLYFDQPQSETLEMWALRLSAGMSDDPSSRITEKPDLYGKKNRGPTIRATGWCVFPYTREKDTRVTGCVHELYANTIRNISPETLADAFDLFSMAAQNVTGEGPIFPKDFTGHVFGFFDPVLGKKTFTNHQSGTAWETNDFWSVVAWVKDGRVITIFSVEHTANLTQFENPHVLYGSPLWTAEQLREMFMEQF